MDPSKGRELSSPRRESKTEQQPSRGDLREVSAERTERWLSSHREQQQQRPSPFETWSEAGSTLPSGSSAGNWPHDPEPISPRTAETGNRPASHVPGSSSLYCSTFGSSTAYGDDSLSTLGSVHNPPASDITLPAGVSQPPIRARAGSATRRERPVLQGGYDADFVTPLDDKHKCSICLMALREPVQTECGHRFCRRCIQPIMLRRRPLCPLDKEPVGGVSSAKGIAFREMIYPDNFCRREVLSLPVKCENSIAGCLWKGPLKELSDHLGECDYSLVLCPNAFRGCTLEIRRVELPAHLENNCTFREVTCPHCDEKLPVSELETHVNEACPQKEIECPNNCGLSVKRLNMPDHLSEQCEKTIKTCRYKEQGCDFKGLIQEMAEHMEQFVQHHLELVSKHSANLTERVARAEKAAEEEKKMVAVLQTDLSQVTARCDLLVETNRITNERFAKLEVLVQNMAPHASVAAVNGASNERLLAVEKKADEAMQKAVLCEAAVVTSKQNSEHCQARVGVLEREVTKCNTIIARTDAIMAEFDLRLLSQETTSFSGIMIWKIPDYRRHFEEARASKKPSLYSPPFFTSRHGYKMCARVYLNGDGVGKGTHMSAFFVVMKGEFDALLSWPFHQKVTLTLLDQSPSKRHISDTFMPDPASSSFQRPSSEMNIASGCPRFVSLDMLRHSTYNYIKDDTIFLRIAVDTTGLASY